MKQLPFFYIKVSVAELTRGRWGGGGEGVRSSSKFDVVIESIYTWGSKKRENVSLIPAP